MAQTKNEFTQPIGAPVFDWAPPAVPPREPMLGRYCRLDPLVPSGHAKGLFKANAMDTDQSNWTYLPYGPFNESAAYQTWLETCCEDAGLQFYTIIDQLSGNPGGIASYLRMSPNCGSIEVGHIHYSNALKRNPAATEAMFLMMARAFDLGYRRYEWKCDALNNPSRAAALRLGFSFEGVFRQATVYKDRNRDTAWYSVIDSEWPRLREAFLRWLDPSNFDGEGR